MQSSDHLALRNELLSRPRLRYEELGAASPRSTEALRRSVEEMLTDGWAMGDSRLDSLVPPIAWKQPKPAFELHVHAWDPVDLLLSGYEATRDLPTAETALSFALDWISTFCEPVLDLDRTKALDEVSAHTIDRAWHQRAVGARAYRLAFLTELVGRSHAETELFGLLLDTLRFHLDLLQRDSFYAGPNHHGLQQTLGQLAAARRFSYVPGFEHDLALGHERLTALVGHSFFPSGVHREHSPGYHHSLLATLVAARSAGLVPRELAELVSRAEEAEGWMTGPRGVLATIGDTDYRERRQGPSSLRHYANPDLQFRLSGGRQGEPAPPGIKAYDDAGLAFVRTASSYLAQTGAFHSRTHKHADHFSFVWWEDDEEVLVDPGKLGYLGGRTEPGSPEHEQGYRYADPRRIYVERTRAHNCVEIDGEDYPRRDVDPFGSALTLAEEQDGLFVTTCEAYHPGSVRHRRTLVLRPGHFLLVLDWLNNRSGDEHDYRQWFQLGSQWAGAGSSYVSPSGRSLWVANLLDPDAVPDAQRGVTEPAMSGWRSDGPRSLVPTTSLHFFQRGRRGRFATLLLLSDAAAPSASAANPSLTEGHLGWREDEVEQRVTLAREGSRLRARFHAG